MARPRLPDDEKARRGTLQPCRVADGASAPSSGAPAAVLPMPGRRDYAGIAAKYIADVHGGALVAGKFVRLACERQVRDRQRSDRDGEWPYVWNQKEADAACAFMEQCPHVEGRWSTPNITLEPFQVFAVSLLFGWRYRADPSRRRFTVFYLEIARKSAKSTIMAAIAYYHLLRENEPGASVVCGATTGQQARVVFGIMQRMARRSAWLRNEGVTVYANAILFSDGTVKPVNSKASSLDGLNPSCIVLDESHAQSFGLHDVLKSAQGARWNPLLLCPTTAGYDLLSVGYAMRTQLAKVLEGVFEADHLLGVIYTLDDGDDWRDPRVWIKASPMIGISPSIDYVRKYCQDAQQAPGVEGEFKVKICNLWAQAASAWLSASQWDRCADDALKLENFKGQPCWIGGDLAQIDDLAAIALVFWLGDLIVGFVQCYLPEGVVAERARTVPAYQQWVNQELLTVTDGNMIDYGHIEADIRAWCKMFDVKEIVFDQFGSAQIAGNLSNDGLPAIIEPKNAKTTTPPCREIEARVRHKRFRHDGNSLLKWAALNVVVTRRTDDTILPKKDHAESPNKIDPMDALVSAVGAQLRSQQRESKFQMFVIGGAPAPGGSH